MSGHEKYKDDGVSQLEIRVKQGPGIGLLETSLKQGPGFGQAGNSSKISPYNFNKSPNPLCADGSVYADAGPGRPEGYLERRAGRRLRTAVHVLLE